MKYYITKTEKRIIIGAIVFYTILTLILCFKGMALMQRNVELINEKEALEQIIEVQKGVIDERDKV